MLSTAAAGALARRAISKEDFAHLVKVSATLDCLLSRPDPEGTIRHFVEHGSMDVVRELARADQTDRWRRRDSYGNRLLQTANALASDRASG